MKINANFDQRVVVHSADIDWLASPMPGVFRRPLDRVGGEVARATSIVRYDPGSSFSPHEHTGGEEFLVLAGVFQDESGDFPIGFYVRNPPSSRHTPSSIQGCVIFVKLWQFNSQDSVHVRLSSNSMASVPHENHSGVSVTPLYRDKFEEVSIQCWQSDAVVNFDFPNGAEILVLEGRFSEGGDSLDKHSWLRLPIGSQFKARAGSNGAKIWIKSGHLNLISNEIERLP